MYHIRKIAQKQGNSLFQKRKVFSFFLKSSTESTALISRGSAFHNFGPTTLNARDWTREDDVRGTCRRY